MNNSVQLHPQRFGQSGVVLLEALVAILIFSIGLLGMLGMQAASVNAVSDAKYRSEAAMVANQIVARMWADQANIGLYDTGGAFVDIDAGESPLHKLGAGIAQKQVLVGPPPLDPLLPQMRTVVVTITWTPPGSTTVRRFVTETQIASTT